MLWSPFETTNLYNPYPMYARLRKEDPVHRSQTGEYIITRYDDVKTILKSSNFRSGNRLEWFSRGLDYFKNHDEDLTNIYRAVCSFILFMNPPDHAVVRSFVAKAWNERNVESMVTEVVDDCLNELPTSFDVVKDYAQVIPPRIICKILGMPFEDFQYLKGLDVKMVRSLDLYHSWKDLVELNEASKAFVKYFEGLIRRKPTTGLLSKLIAANEKEKVLNEEQMISISIFMFIAGEETAGRSIATGLFHFIKDPQTYQQLRNNPVLLASTALEELFRFDGPIHVLGRISKEETVFSNTTIPANSPVTLVLGSANRDENQFSEPTSFNITRSPNQHLAFGYGSHFCMGEWLGKMQARIAFQRFMAKFRSVDIPPQDIRWVRNIAVRGMTSINVTTRE